MAKTSVTKNVLSVKIRFIFDIISCPYALITDEAICYFITL